jgi:hypothetical protein
MLRAVGHLSKGLPKDSEEAIFYRRLMRIIIVVDRMHFKVRRRVSLTPSHSHGPHVPVPSRSLCMPHRTISRPTISVRRIRTPHCMRA